MNVDVAHDEHRLRCRSFVLRTGGTWTRVQRESLDAQLEGKGLKGPTEAVLQDEVTLRARGGLYLCQGSSCAPKAQAHPSPKGLPIHPTACLGHCRHSPNAHRVHDGQGTTYVHLGQAHLQTLVSGEDSEALQRRRVAPSGFVPHPALEPLAWLMGLWEGPGGFGAPKGCTRYLEATYALGGRFLNIQLSNAWPTLIGDREHFPELLILQGDDTGLKGRHLNDRGGDVPIEGHLDGGALTLHYPEDPARRWSLSPSPDGRISERQERLKRGQWSLGFVSKLGRGQP